MSSPSVEPELPSGLISDEVDALFAGAIDTHVHPGPSPLARRMGIVEAASDAATAGYRAIVVKSHHHSMQTDVLALGEAGLTDIDCEVYAGVALNAYVGGINPYAVELCLALGGRIVWFPTYSSHAHIVANADRPHAGPLRVAPEVAVLDADGHLLPEVIEVLELAAANDAIVTGGHLAAPVIDVLFEEARRRGVERLLVNHPQYIVGATPDDVRRWARAGAYIEHSVGMYHDSAGHKPPRYPRDELRAYIEAAGTTRTIFVSDTGQAGNLRPVDVVRLICLHLLAEGADTQSLRQMTGGNAAELLFG